NHLPAVRAALRQLAQAACDLKAYAEVRVQEPGLPQRCIHFLAQGLRQLEEGMDATEKKAIKDLRLRSYKVLGSPGNRVNEDAAAADLEADPQRSPDHGYQETDEEEASGGAAGQSSQGKPPGKIRWELWALGWKPEGGWVVFRNYKGKWRYDG